MSKGGTNHWLVKTEPDSFSWDMQTSRDFEPWTGVRSHQAKRNLQAMAEGDHVFFYHSNTGKEIVGVVEVIRAAYPDPTAETGDWVCVDMRAVAPMPKPVTLAAMREDPALDGFVLLRASRLSVVPVTPEQWRHICRVGGYKGK